jgi:hypothetical protein
VSHSPGHVIDARGEIVGHFEYNGTVCVARFKIFATAEDRDAAWRQDQPSPCTCEGVEVTLVTESIEWDARACFDHGFIVKDACPIYGPDEDDVWPLSQRPTPRSRPRRA